MANKIVISFFIVLCNIYSFSQSTEKKFALVIGVKSYKNVQPLTNTLNDASDFTSLLKARGFTVIEVLDPKSKKELRTGIIKYYEQLRNNPEATGIFYYSGHGMQVDGENYLIPAEADIAVKADIEDQCLKFNFLMEQLSEAGNKLNVFIIDACRNNPFKGFYKSSEQGLAPVNAPTGSYILYATKPGSVASDGTERNGLFTSKLLKYLAIPNVDIYDAFQQVIEEVSRDSDKRQRPNLTSDYTGKFYFSGKSSNIANNISTAPQTILETPSVAENIQYEILEKAEKDYIRLEKLWNEKVITADDWRLAKQDYLRVLIDSKKTSGDPVYSEVPTNELLQFKDTNELLKLDIKINNLNQELRKKNTVDKVSIEQIKREISFHDLRKENKVPLPIKIFDLKIAELEYLFKVNENVVKVSTSDQASIVDALRDELALAIRLENISKTINLENIESNAFEYTDFVLNAYGSISIMKSFLRSLEQFASDEITKQTTKLRDLNK